MPKHSPTPWTLETVKPTARLGFHLIRDAYGDTLASLAYRTGDHPAEEQLANARLFLAAPRLAHFVQALARLQTESECDEHDKPMSNDYAVSTLSATIELARGLLAVIEGRDDG